MSKKLLQRALDALQFHTWETHPIVETENTMLALEAELAKPEQDVDFWIRAATQARQAEIEMRREIEVLTQPLPDPTIHEDDVWRIEYYTPTQIQEAIKKAVEAERAIHNERLKFTVECWKIECESQVEIEREACAILCDKMDEDSYPDRKVWPFECATAIRARKYNPTF